MRHPGHLPQRGNVAIFFRCCGAIRTNPKDFYRSALDMSLISAPGGLDKKRAAPMRVRPEFREETPVTRQKEDQPSSCQYVGASEQRGTTSIDAAIAEKKGFQTPPAQ
jgi:hypothetical protein